MFYCFKIIKMLEITSPITGERLRVAENDFEEILDWFQAKSACGELGNGWRLPTRSELELMYKDLHKKGNGNFKKSFYWSSTENASSSASYVGFADGYASTSRKDDTNYVRAVRAL